MRLPAADVAQILRQQGVKWVDIEDDASGVVRALKEIDSGFHVKLGVAGNPPFYALYHRSDDGRDEQLVLTIQAEETKLGALKGLDHRMVRRVREISDEKYDYIGDLTQIAAEKKEKQREDFRKKIESEADRAAFLVRKASGNGVRVAVPNKP